MGERFGFEELLFMFFMFNKIFRDFEEMVIEVKKKFFVYYSVIRRVKLEVYR